MIRLYYALLILTVALLAGACGDDGGGGASTPLACDGAASATCAGGTPSVYPSGPYATDTNVVGQVLENHTFTTPDGETLSFGDLRSAGGKTLLLLSTTAGWCTACIEEQPKLKELYESYGCDGLEVMVAIFEDGFFNPANAVHASQWQQQYALNFPVVADTDNVLGTYYDTSAAPLNMLVDLCTMEVIYSEIGFSETAVTALIESNLD